MQTIGELTRDMRYERLSVRERCVAEFVRRIRDEDWTFKTAKWGMVLRSTIPEDYKGTKGAVLGVVEGEEVFGTTTQAAQNKLDLAVEFSVKPAVDEEPATVVNLIAAELVEILSGQHELREGGDGAALSLTLYARSYTPDLAIMRDVGMAYGVVTFELQYRHRTNRPFELHNHA